MECNDVIVDVIVKAINILGKRYRRDEVETIAWEKYLGGAVELNDLIDAIKAEISHELEWGIKTISIHNLNFADRIADDGAPGEDDDDEDEGYYEEEEEESKKRKEMFENLQKHCTKEQIVMLTLRFGYDQSLRDIARMMGCSHEKVRQMTDIEKLRARLKIEKKR